MHDHGSSSDLSSDQQDPDITIFDCNVWGVNDFNFSGYEMEKMMNDHTDQSCKKEQCTMECTCKNMTEDGKKESKDEQKKKIIVKRNEERALLQHPFLPYRHRSSSKIKENTAEKPGREIHLPGEIRHMIMKCLLPDDRPRYGYDLCSATCFALTSRANWAVFRRIHPQKIPLDAPSPFISEGIDNFMRLGSLLCRWMGPNYRLVIYPPESEEYTSMKCSDQYPRIFLYVDLKTYPEIGGAKERRILRRIMEHKEDLIYSSNGSYSTPRSLVQPNSSWQLVPNPITMGEKWYLATLTLIKSNIFDWPMDCTDDDSMKWLRADNYHFHYEIWKHYQHWSIREWIEEQPVALEYKKIHGISGTTESMLHAFQMLRLVGVPAEDHKASVKASVDVMSGNVERSIEEMKILREDAQ